MTDLCDTRITADATQICPSLPCRHLFICEVTFDPVSSREISEISEHPFTCHSSLSMATFVFHLGRTSCRLSVTSHVSLTSDDVRIICIVCFHQPQFVLSSCGHETNPVDLLPRIVSTDPFIHLQHRTVTAIQEKDLLNDVMDSYLE